MEQVPEKPVAVCDTARKLAEAGNTEAAQEKINTRIDALCERLTSDIEMGPEAQVSALQEIEELKSTAKELSNAPVD